MDNFGKYLFSLLKFTTQRPQFEFYIYAYRESLSFLLQASVNILRGDGPSVRLEGIVGFGLRGSKSMAW
jgi:hypothetical protein